MVLVIQKILYPAAYLMIIISLISSCSKDQDIPVAPQNEEVGITVPDGFQVEEFTEGLDLPTSMVFAPDESRRLFVNELQSGKIRIVEDGELLPEAFAQVETNVTGGFPVEGENGLLGIAFDPDYASNRYVYASYAVRTDTGTYGKVVRFTDVDNQGEDMQVLIDGLPSAEGHQIESIQFGPDEKLYVSVGDAYESEKAQDPGEYNGKILRINKDGSIPADNPFPDSEVWAMGFRNCFDMAFLPDGRLLTTDNGPERADEINLVKKEGNYGWPDALGRQDNSEFIDPIYVWEEIVAPTGMLVYEGTNFPSRYRDKLFIVLFGHTNPEHHDHGSKRIMMANINGDGDNPDIELEEFAAYTESLEGNPIDITVGPEGRMYVNDFFKGKIYRIGHR